ncbi:MAG: nucleotidyltransferase family protein, partial [Planctomycetota bacterium]
MSDQPDFEKLLSALLQHNVNFIVVGGISAVLQGAPLSTFDLDIVHERSPENIERLIAALIALKAHYRGRTDLAPKPDHLEGDGHVLLDTQSGPLDILGAIGSGHDYTDLIDHTNPFTFDNLEVRILDLPTLIQTKEECGREK